MISKLSASTVWQLREHRPHNLLRLVGLLIVLVCLLWARSGGAQTVDGTQTLQFCNWRPALSTGQAEFVASLVPLASQFNSHVTYRGTDQDTFSMLRECTLDVRRRACTDKLLMGLLDPRDAVIGGVAGMAIDRRNGPNLLGGLIGSGAAGMIGGVVSLGHCNKIIEEVYAPIARRLGPVFLTNLEALRYDDYRERVAKAMRSGMVTAADGAHLLRFTDQVAKAARESR